MKFLILSAITIFSTASLATPFPVGPLTHKERVIRDQTVPSQIQLDATTVRCSAIGYSQAELKISVPDLEFLAVFNHTNFGESAPCMTAGACQPGRMPANILTSEPTEDISLHVVLKETYDLDAAAKTCQHTLIEEISTVVRGVPFFHQRSADLGDFPFDLCQKL